MKRLIVIGLFANAILLAGRFVQEMNRAADAETTEWIVDNGQPGTSSTGTWSVSGGANPYGANSVYAKNGPTYTWVISGLTPGTYEVYAWWTTFASRGTQVPYEVSHADGTSTVRVNQQLNGGQWNLLGKYELDTAVRVRVVAVGMTSTCADAIRVVKTSTGAVLTPEQAEILSHMSIEYPNSGTYCVVDPENPASECGADPPPSATAKTIRISGVNVQIVNGSGATDTVNGLGNLIVGYQEERIGLFDDPSPCHDTQINERGGSHNVVVGRKNSYKSWGSAVVGDTNTASQRWACAVGGRNNHAKKEGCFVGGGSGNYAIEDRTAIVGGSGNCVSEVDRGLLGTHEQSIGECFTDCFLWDE